MFPSGLSNRNAVDTSKEVLIGGDSANQFEVKTSAGTSVLKVDAASGTCTIPTISTTTITATTLNCTTANISSTLDTYDSILALNTNATDNANDIGFYGKYVSSGTKYGYLARKNGTSDWYLGMSATAPSNKTIDFGDITRENLQCGRVYSGDGTVLLPAITFAGDTDTGIYSIGANNLGIAVGGVKKLDVGATDISAVANVIPSANATYTCGSSANKWLYTYSNCYFSNTGGPDAPAYSFSGDEDSGLYRIGANNIGLSTNAVLRVNISDATTAITNALSVAGVSSFADGAFNLPGITFTSDPNTGIYRIGADNIGISTNGTKRIDVADATTTITNNLTATDRLSFDASNNTKCGYQAGYSSSGTGNTLLGVSAGYAQNGNYNVHLGNNAGYSNVGEYNFFGSTLSGYDIRNANNCVFIGKNAARSAAGSYADWCIALGDSALYNITGSSGTHVLDMVAIGRNAFSSSTTGYSSVGIGYYAGSNNKTGNNNNFIGYECGKGTSGATNTSSQNNAMGYQALYKITDGADYNVALGHQAGYNITSGGHNVALGYKSGFSLTTTVGAIAIGQSALYTNISGAWNIAMGYEALRSLTSANNTGIGHRAFTGISGAGSANTGLGSHVAYNHTGSDANTYIGHQAGYGALDGGSACTTSNNVAVGYQSMYSITTNGITNTAVGYRSGYSLSTGIRNCSFGNESLYSQTTTTGNCAFGNSALRASITGTQLSAFGYQALYASTANNNSAFGWNAGVAVVDGADNTLLGNSTAATLVSGANNIIIGSGANVDNSARANATVIGKGATSKAYNNSITLGFGTTAVDRTFIDGCYGKTVGSTRQFMVVDSAGQVGGTTDVKINNTVYFTGFGNNAGVLTTAESCTAMGYNALQTNVSGGDCTAFGSDALNSCTADGNTAFGSSAGFTIGSGAYNTCIGHAADVDTAARTNCIVIGRTAITKAYDNSCTIGFGASALTKIFIEGIYGTTVGATYQTMYVDNTGMLGGLTSSKRYKREWSDMQGSERIYGLRPVNFFYKQDYAPNNQIKQWGLLAEEVHEVLPELVNYDDQGRPDSIKDQLLTPMLLNENIKLKNRVDELESRINTLEIMLSA